MKFDYLKQPNFRDPQKPWVSRPFIPVRLFYQNSHIDLFALIDSGADACLFHISLGRALGIPVEQGERQVFYGIEASGVEVYFHQIRLEIRGVAGTIVIKAGFVDSKNVSGILGQQDFFENYKITFERSKEIIEINPIRK